MPRIEYTIANIGFAAMLFASGCTANRPAQSANERQRADQTTTVSPTSERPPAIIDQTVIPAGFIPVPISSPEINRWSVVPGTKAVVTEYGKRGDFDNYYSPRNISRLINETGLAQFGRVEIILDGFVEYNHQILLPTAFGCTARLIIAYAASMEAATKSLPQPIPQLRLEQSLSRHNDALLVLGADSLSLKTNFKNCSVQDRPDPDNYFNYGMAIAEQKGPFIWNALQVKGLREIKTDTPMQ